MYRKCEGWRYAFWRAGNTVVPVLGSTFEGALKAFLATPATNYNVPLLACHLGTMLLDRDGTAACLSEKAAELWRIGPPPPDLGRSPRLLWEMKRICADARRWRQSQPRGPLQRARREASMAAALERALVAFCRLNCLWSLPIAELDRVANDERYSSGAARAAEFFAAGDPEAKARAVLAAAELVIRAIPPMPTHPNGPPPPLPTRRPEPGNAQHPELRQFHPPAP